eukprot:gene16172-19249_t
MRGKKSKSLDGSGVKKEEDGGVEIESLAKKQWTEVWDLIAKMREETEAPVDWAGCEAFSDDTLEARISRFHVLVACLLSSQTKDAVTDAAMKKLKQHGLTVDNIISTTHETLETLLYPVSFYKRKSIGDIPKEFKDIMDLPGFKWHGEEQKV